MQTDAAARDNRIDVLRRLAFAALLMTAAYGYAYQHVSQTAKSFIYGYLTVTAILLWLPQKAKSPIVLFVYALASEIALIVAVKVFGAESNIANLLIIPAGISASSRQLSRKQSLFVLLSLVATSVFCFSGNASAMMSASFSLLGVYFGILGTRWRKESRRLDQLRLAQLEIAHEELKKAHEQLQTTTAQAMQSAALAERAHIARDIHDGVGHQLTSLIVQLQAVDLMLPDDAVKAKERIPDMLKVARQAVADVRIAVREWTEDVSQLGLSALRGLTHQAAGHGQIVCEFRDLSPVSKWPSAVSMTLYRALQESLTNAMRHSGATRIEVTVEEKDLLVMLRVTDDGGYNGQQDIVPGFGLKQMQERCLQMGGNMKILANIPHGLTVEVQMPVQEGE